MWWVYNIPPSAQVLHAYRNRASVWGYAQLVIVASIGATGPVCTSRRISSSTGPIPAHTTVLGGAIPVGVMIRRLLPSWVCPSTKSKLQT